MTDRYEVELSKREARELRKLDRSVQARLLAAIALLRDEPRPATVKALAGHPGLPRVRIGGYRIVCSVDGERLIVLVLPLEGVGTHPPLVVGIRR